MKAHWTAISLWVNVLDYIEFWVEFNSLVTI